MTIVWWRGSMTSGKETTVLCLNQMNLRHKMSLLALPQGVREKEGMGIENRAVWKGRSPARFTLCSWLLAVGKQGWSAPQGSQHSVHSCETNGALRMLSSQLWRVQANGEEWSFSVVYYAAVSAQVWRLREIQVGLKMCWQEATRQINKIGIIANYIFLIWGGEGEEWEER